MELYVYFDVVAVFQLPVADYCKIRVETKRYCVCIYVRFHNLLSVITEPE